MFAYLCHITTMSLIVILNGPVPCWDSGHELQIFLHIDVQNLEVIFLVQDISCVDDEFILESGVHQAKDVKVMGITFI